MSFSGKISLAFTKYTANSFAKRGASQVATKAVKTVASEKIPFCQQYYQLCKEKGLLDMGHKTFVSFHDYLNGINHFFISPPNPKAINEVISYIGKSPREIIKATDLEFKTLKPLGKETTVIRCIGEKPDFFSEYKLYQKRLGIKKGDIIDMKEYAYATTDRSYAEVYLPSGKGITYEIEVPANAKISKTGTEYTFPRSSKFECLDTKQTDKGLLARLRYLVPNDV